MDISEATARNWQRLKSDAGGKLRHRANKSCSEKRICPLEYVNSKKCIDFAENISRLSREYGISRDEVIVSLAVKQLENAGIRHLEHVENVLAEMPCKVNEALSELTLPQDETDILGFVYQCLLSEGEKNIAGAYYTPQKITEEMISDWDFSGGKEFFDPCCGSGAFLLAVQTETPAHLWGCDKDPIAVFIAKVNLLCKYREQVFSPQIFCCDYLEKTSPYGLFERRFDFISTNPPWGAEKNRRKGEKFTHFFCKASEQLKEGGKICFLFPESVLRIKCHAGLRRFWLEKLCPEKIVRCDMSFSGVMTGVVSLSAEKSAPGESFELICGQKHGKLSREEVLKNKDCAVIFAAPEDLQILEHVRAQKNFYLTGSIFALGIVTGDNKKKVSRIRKHGMEPVITGREVGRYLLKEAVNFLYYDRKSFQQTAPDEYYRAKEKLVYRFISKSPVFAYDDSTLLCLNSANVLIPSIPGMSVKTVLAFLNSKFLRYYYRLVFKDVKILKGNLLQLPFPEISPETAVEIDRLTGYILNGCVEADERLQELIYRCYRLSPEQIQVVEKNLLEGSL